MPLLAPVMITLRPCMPGSEVELEVVIGNNVDYDNNGVNDNFV